MCSQTPIPIPSALFMKYEANFFMSLTLLKLLGMNNFIISLMRHEACDRARDAIQTLRAARSRMHVELYEELLAGLTMLADTILLCRDWHSYLLVQYGIERGVYPPDRVHLGLMSRYAEQFIRNLRDLAETEAGRRAAARVEFPDPFPLS